MGWATRCPGARRPLGYRVSTTRGHWQISVFTPRLPPALRGSPRGLHGRGQSPDETLLCGPPRASRGTCAARAPESGAALDRLWYRAPPAGFPPGDANGLINHAASLPEHRVSTVTHRGRAL